MDKNSDKRIEEAIVTKADTLLTVMCWLFSHMGPDFFPNTKDRSKDKIREKIMSHILCGDVKVNNCVIKNHLERVKKGDKIRFSLSEYDIASRSR